MASDPALAEELQSVAKLQKQIIILKKSNNSLRTNKAASQMITQQKIEDKELEIEDLKS